MILPFNLQYVASGILQVITLYDPEPAFQYSTNTNFTLSITPDQYLNRDTTVASAGFPASYDFGQFATGNLPPIGTGNNIPLPANSYVSNNPSNVYGTDPSKDTYSVLQINTALAQIEPGFSRIRVDYTYIDNTQSPAVTAYATEYFDCPFYEGFNVTARELNNIVGYIEGGIGFVQGEINTLNNQIQYALSRELWRGTSVSGQISTSGPITSGLQTGAITDEEHGFHLDGGCESCNNLMFKTLNNAIDSKGIGTPPSGYSGANNPPANVSDFDTIINSFNAPGKTSQGNYTYIQWAPTNYSGTSYTSTSLITENTDGTLTYWMSSTTILNPPAASDTAHIPKSYTYNNSNFYSNNFNNYVNGPVNVEAGSTGASYNVEFNIATGSYNLTEPKYLAQNCLHGTGNIFGTPVETVVGNAISTVTISTNGNTLPWVRIVTQPQGVVPGQSQITFNTNTNQITPVNMIYDSGFLAAGGSSGTWDNTNLSGNGGGGQYSYLASNSETYFGENYMECTNDSNNHTPSSTLSYAISQPMDVVAGKTYTYSAVCGALGTQGTGKAIGLVPYTSKRTSGNQPNFISGTKIVGADNKETNGASGFSGSWLCASDATTGYTAGQQICMVIALNCNGNLNNSVGHTLFMGCPMFEESSTYSGYVTGPINQIINMTGVPGSALTLNGPVGLVPTITYISTSPGNTSTSVEDLCPGGSYYVNGTNIASTYTLYLGNNQTPCATNYDGGQYYASFTVPAGAPQGSSNLFFSNGTHNSNNSSVTILALPTITGIYPNSNQSVGVMITIAGTGFGVYNQTNSQVAFYQGEYFGTISSWTDTQIVVTVPDIESQGAPVTYPCNTEITVITAQCNGRASNAFTIYSGQYDVLTINPSTLNLNINSTHQFSANLNNPNYNTNNDVTNNQYTTWGIYAIEGGNPIDIGNGNATYGTISSTGLYTAPNTTPPNQTASNAVVIPYCKYVGPDFQGDNVNLINNSQVFIELSASLSIYNPNNNFLGTNTGKVQIPGQVQFIAYFTENGTTTNVSNSSIWYVNGIQGGNTVNGTITSTGLYSTPIIPPSTNPAVIEATYYLSNNSTTYQATTNIDVVVQATNQIVITVTSQLNIYLGDGRFGYVPVGTSLVCNLNDYLYVQFSEQILQNTTLPNPTYNPVQQLSLNKLNALDANISKVMYNTSDAIPQTDGSTLTKRTVVLGIVDPSDGYFHSMWDIANPPAVPADEAHGMSISVQGADKIKAFDGSHSYKGTIMDYVNDLTGGAQKHLDIMMNQANIMLVGAASYDISSNKLIIVKPLRILGISEEKTYGIIGIVPEQELQVKSNEYVYIDSEQKLRVGKFSEAFNSTNPNIIILGAVLDNFYTTWPLIEGLDADSSGVKNLGENSWLKVGPLLIQWGTSDSYSVMKKDSLVTDKIIFPIEYEKSCSVMVSPIDTNGAFPIVQSNDTTLQSFNVRIMNNQSVNIQTKISWLSIGL